ncbi:MAG: hypothetical protein MJ091_06600, partial [Clostridia bacterium]|nr:hypothetical protein [Clostridia bacterium]
MAKKKKSAKSGAAANQTAKKRNADRQIKTVIMFVVALFLLFVVFIKGESVWTYMHDFLYGVFGIMAPF